MQRRLFIKLLSLLAVTKPLWPQQVLAENKLAISKLLKKNNEWRSLLSPPQYAILFDEETERPNSSHLNNEKRAGTYICAACYLPLFSSKHKYESGTGWPSFWQEIEKEHIGFKRDYQLIWPRTEYHCARCGGHQGHLFNDGPKPTGLRYCNNGLALQFISEKDVLPALRT